ncbi:MAG: c-type cytochrome [Planctomycetaceae bacterium]|nr:c-type cytochrome [Planctomycetaceae bacterium]
MRRTLSIAAILCALLLLAWAGQNLGRAQNNPAEPAAGEPAAAGFAPLEHPPSVDPAEAVKLFTVPDDLSISLVAAEPDVSQPLSISFDDRGRMWVLQYLQYPNPEGLKAVQMDNWLRTKYDRIPPAPPEGPQGRDRISIYSDSNGDGQADSVKHFIANLNLASGFAIGYDGVFVVQPPYLLFYADRNHDDVPDGNPEVLLTGFGMDDAHAFANSLTWGPDGWLYGCQGSTATADIRGIGFQQGVWRYHPLTKEFELFGEGGGNSWGVEFDRYGNVYSAGNEAEPLVHMVQGAYYVKGFGKHGPLHNPHTYGYFQPVRHIGYLGDSLSGGSVIYQGGAFPERFNGNVISPHCRHSATRWATLRPEGSTFVTEHAGDFITTTDIWYRPVEQTVGPDGALYVADWYDFNISHSNPQNRSEWYQPSRFDGRVWRVAPPAVKPVATDSLNLAMLSSAELIPLLTHHNDWYARQARQMLAERRDRSVTPQLRELLASDDERTALEGLWSLYVIGSFDHALAVQTLASQHEYLRSWTVRLLGDAKVIPETLQPRLVELARTDSSPVVRAQLACTAKRVPAAQCMPIVRELLRRSEDTGDTFIPLLVWWAIESKSVSDPDLVLSLVEEREAWSLPLMRQFITQRLARRYAAEGTDDAFAACARLVSLAPDQTDTDLLVAGFVEALSGRSLDSPPAPIAPSIQKLLARHADNPAVIELALRLGSADGVRIAMQRIADTATPEPARIALIKSVGEVRAAGAIDALLALAAPSQSDAVQTAALSALGYYDDPALGTAVLLAYPKLAAGAQARAIELLASRAEWSPVLIGAVEAKSIDPKSVSITLVRQMLDRADEPAAAAITKLWGRVAPETTLEKVGRITALSQMLARKPGDAAAGAAVFEKTCSKCHKLNGKGENIGPDLTTAERRDRDKLLSNIVDPSAVVRQEFISHVLLTTDGRVITGLLAESTPETVTILDEKNKRTIVSRGEIDELQESQVSLMPEKLLDPLTEQQIRDLMAYIQAEAPPVAGAGGQ